MSHELPAAGAGFSWPKLVFESDGEFVDIKSFATEGDVTPIQYLASLQQAVSASDFENVVDGFMELVLGRLKTFGMQGTELDELWSTVLEERRDPDKARFRRLEAELGFDPEEGPESTVRQFAETSNAIGESATDELAAALAVNENPSAALHRLLSMAKDKGLPGRIEPSLMNGTKADENARTSGAFGWKLAQEARKSLSLGESPIDDGALGSLLGITAHDLENPPIDIPPIGLGIRSGKAEEVKIFFRKRNLAGRRFEAARLLAEALSAPNGDRWLPLTDSKTARQKVQRAFAAEFLCPFDSLMETLRGSYSVEAIEEAGERFRVSPLAIESHLVNHGVIAFAGEQ